MTTVLGGTGGSGYRVTVLLNEKIYNPGDVIEGEVVLDLDRALFADEIFARFHGEIRVFWTENKFVAGSTKQHHSYSQQRALVSQRANLWQAALVKVDEDKGPSISHILRHSSSTSIRLDSLRKSTERPHLAAGTHKFAISFVVPPSGLYTSFDSRIAPAHIRYYVIVEALSSGRQILRRKHLFPVVCPADLSRDPRALEEASLEETVKVGKGNVRVRLHVPKRGFVPGEPVGVTCVIENNSTKSIKYAVLNVEQRAFCVATEPDVATREATLETNGAGMAEHKILAGQSLTYRPRFNIPALTPNLEVPDCLLVDYRLKLTVGFNRGTPKGAFLRLSVPILLGTVPTCGDFKGEPRPPVYMPSAPPAYVASEGGVGRLGEDEDADYTPVYAFYDFPVEVDEEKKLL